MSAGSRWATMASLWGTRVMKPSAERRLKALATVMRLTPSSPAIRLPTRGSPSAQRPCVIALRSASYAACSRVLTSTRNSVAYCMQHTVRNCAEWCQLGKQAAGGECVGKGRPSQHTVGRGNDRELPYRMRGGFPELGLGCGETRGPCTPLRSVRDDGDGGANGSATTGGHSGPSLRPLAVVGMDA